MKTYWVIFASVAALLLVVFVVLDLTLGSLVKKEVERYGPEYTQTKVSVGMVHLSPVSGSGAIDNLVIGNPPGWESDHALSVGKIAIDIAPTSLLGDHIVIRSLVIESPDIIYETKFLTSNLQDLLKNIQHDNSGTESASPEEKTPKKIEILSLKLTHVKITVIANGRTQVVNMPSISMENLGSASGGLPPAQISATIVREMIRQSITAAARGFMNSDSLNKAAQKAVNGLRKLLNADQDQPAATASP